MATVKAGPRVAETEAPKRTSTPEEPKYEALYYDQPPLPLPPAAVVHHRRRLFWWAVRYAAVGVVVLVGLLIPLIVFASDAFPDENATPEAIQASQYGNLVFFICLWLEVTWIAAVFFDLFGLGLPYLFRFIARFVVTTVFRMCIAHYSRYVNSSHQRYWRIFKFMRRPICFLFTTIITFSCFTVVCLMAYTRSSNRF